MADLIRGISRRLRVVAVLTAVALALSVAAHAASAAKIDPMLSRYFVDAGWLKDNLKKVAIIDVRGEPDYRRGHIPGAVNAPWTSLADMEPKQGDPGWAVVLPPEKLAARLGALAIDGQKPVVVYGMPKSWGEDGRVVWTLRYAGLKDVKMLNGGWPAWRQADGPITLLNPDIARVAVKLGQPDQSLIATTGYIKANMGRIKIVDARSLDEYTGRKTFGEKRGGHIPGAIHLDFNLTYNDDGTVKSVPELKAMFEKAGLKPDDEIVTYCTAGVRSGYLALILRLAGFAKASNYNASISEWAGDPANPMEQ